MKFVCSQSALIKAVSTVSRAVSSKSSLSILKGILLTVKENELFLSASDLDISIDTSIGITDGEDGSLVVPARMFGDIIRKLPNSLISVYSLDGKVNIRCLNSFFSIIYMEADEFPIIKAPVSAEKLVLIKDDFRSLINSVSFNASIDEKKGILTGILFNIFNNSIDAVALDGFRMAVCTKNTVFGGEKKIVIPASALNEAAKIVSDDDSGEISICIEDKKIGFESGNTRVVARLMDGEFIKYREILPTNYRTRIIVEREDMLLGIERAALFSADGKYSLVKLNITDNKVNITSESKEGRISEDISAEKDGEDLLIGFNSKYLTDVLKNIKEDEVIFEFGTSVSSCIIKSANDSSCTYLVVPVRIS